MLRSSVNARLLNWIHLYSGKGEVLNECCWWRRVIRGCRRGSGRCVRYWWGRSSNRWGGGARYKIEFDDRVVQSGERVGVVGERVGSRRLGRWRWDRRGVYHCLSLGVRRGRVHGRKTWEKRGIKRAECLECDGNSLILKWTPLCPKMGTYITWV
jgi:hypothetical protein